MKNIRSIQDSVTVSAERQSEYIQIPVFNFNGAIEPSISDRWFPPYNLRITHGYVACTTTGTSTCSFALIKYSTMNPGGTAISSANLTNGSYKAELLMPSSSVAVVSPFEWIIVAAFNSSGHEGVTISLFGKKVYS